MENGCVSRDAFIYSKLASTKIVRRYYDPQLGRFTQEDPIRFNSGDFNLYRYAYNHPTGFTDPSGEDAAEVLILIWATVAAATDAYFGGGGLGTPCEISRWTATTFGNFPALPDVLDNPSAFAGGGRGIQKVNLTGANGCGDR